MTPLQNVLEVDIGGGGGMGYVVFKNGQTPTTRHGKKNPFFTTMITKLFYHLFRMIMSID